jgi:transposase
VGIKSYQEKMFYNFSLSKRVPEDHFLRKVAKVVDLSFVRKLVKPYCSYTGQPSIDPIVLFKMTLIGYF